MQNKGTKELSMFLGTEMGFSCNGPTTHLVSIKCQDTGGG